MSELARPGPQAGEVVSLFPGEEESPRAAGPHLSGISIDGFGALCDLELAPLGPGLTVLLGPNEAGKSTLFDFISTLLFGFPARKADERYHAPVRGGRHGGRLTVTDQAGEPWVIERFSQPKKTFSLRRPDGSLAEESELRRLLGGATEELFRAVFAVNLDDLRQLDGMSSDEVREVLFSSSILGQRRSTARALSELEDACDSLVRPRQGALANALAEELRSADAELAEAKRRAGGFAAREAERSELSRRAGELQEAQEEARRRLRDLELLDKAWEATTRARTLEEELARLGPSPDEERLLGRAGRLHALRGELSVHLERLEGYEEDRQRQAKLAESVRERAVALGGDEAVATVRAPGFDPEILRLEFDALRDDLGRAESRHGTIADRVASEKRATEALSRPGDGRELPPAGVLEHRLEVLSQLRAWSDEKDLLGRQLEQRELEARALSPEPGLGRGALLAAGLLAAALAALGAVIAAKGEALYGLPVVVVAAALAALSLAAARRAKRPAEPAGSVVEETTAVLRQRYEEATSALARLSREAGLSLPVSPVALQERLAETERLRDERRSIDDQANRAESAARRLGEEEAALSEARSQLEEHKMKLAAFAARVGAGESSVDELADRLTRLEKLRDRLDALERLDGQLERARRSIEAFEERFCSFAADLSEPVPSKAGHAHLPAQVVRGLLEEVADRLEQAEARSRRRGELEAERSAAEAEIDRLLGHGAHADELRDELAGGERLEWRAELALVERSIASLQQERDDIVRREEGLARELDALAASADVPRLEQACFELEEQLGEALERYLVASGARLLLHETLRRYEKERQPAVLALASEHFARVTEGRYVRLGVDSAPDGTKPVVKAFSPDGASIDAGSLSRGAMEQLYLSLRLGLAESFAERYLPLPLVLDDVLVNSDPGRREQMARELALTAERHQLLFLTCHPDVAELLQEVSGSAGVLELSRL